MTVSIEQNPLFRAAQVAFEESRYARRAAVAQVDAEFTARAEQDAKAAAESGGRLDALERGVRERAEPAPVEDPARWVPKANRQVVMSFGDEELRAEAAEAAPETTPIPVQAAPPTVPIPVQPVEPAREPERYLSFGGEEDEPAPEPRAQPRPTRQAGQAESDDDDLSGHTWMR